MIPSTFRVYQKLFLVTEGLRQDRYLGLDSQRKTLEYVGARFLSIYFDHTSDEKVLETLIEETATVSFPCIGFLSQAAGNTKKFSQHDTAVGCKNVQRQLKAFYKELYKKVRGIAGPAVRVVTSNRQKRSFCLCATIDENTPPLISEGERSGCVHFNLKSYGFLKIGCSSELNVRGILRLFLGEKGLLSKVEISIDSSLLENCFTLAS